MLTWTQYMHSKMVNYPFNFAAGSPPLTAVASLSYHVMMIIQLMCMLGKRDMLGIQIVITNGKLWKFFLFLSKKCITRYFTLAFCSRATWWLTIDNWVYVTALKHGWHIEKLGLLCCFYRCFDAFTVYLQLFPQKKLIHIHRSSPVTSVCGQGCVMKRILVYELTTW